MTAQILLMGRSPVLKIVEHHSALIFLVRGRHLKMHSFGGKP